MKNAAERDCSVAGILGPVWPDVSERKELILALIKLSSPPSTGSSGPLLSAPPSSRLQATEKATA